MNKKCVLRHCDLDLWPKVTKFNRVWASAVSSYLAKTASKSVHPFGWNFVHKKSGHTDRQTDTHTHTDKLQWKYNPSMISRRCKNKIYLLASVTNTLDEKQTTTNRVTTILHRPVCMMVRQQVMFDSNLFSRSWICKCSVNWLMLLVTFFKMLDCRFANCKMNLLWNVKKMIFNFWAAKRTMFCCFVCAVFYNLINCILVSRSNRLVMG